MNIIMGIISLVLFLVLMFAGFNIAFSMFFGGAVGLVLIKGASVAGTMIASEFVNTFANYSLAVGPMFGLMGYLASYTGIGAELFNCLKTFLGHKKGGLASAVQVASAAFGGICGNPVACMATMTSVAYPEMRKSGYSKELSAIAIAAGCSLATLIPPSSTFIIYGIATETNISHLFLAGIVPGILCCIVNIFTIRLTLRKHPDWATTTKKYSWRERFEALKHGGVVEVAVVFVIAMGGMFAGFFTPTEAGAIGVIGMAVVSMVGRKFTWKKFTTALWSGVRLQAMIYLLLAAANVLAKMLSVATIPHVIGAWVEGLGMHPVAVMLIILLIYFILGMFTDLNGMILVTLPMFFPIITEYCGYSAIWFGVVIDFMMTIGSLSPPVGTCIFFQKAFVQQWDPDLSVGTLFKAGMPYMIGRILMIGVFILVPQIITCLPHWFYGVPW